MIVPVIDISAFVHADAASEAARAEVVAQVEHACRHVGFLVLTNHGVAPETVGAAFAAAKDYFDQPQEVKKLVPMTADYPYGYESAEILSKSRGDESKKLPDLKETFQICIGAEGKTPQITPKWPETPEEFQDVLTNYYRGVEKLAATVMGIFALALKLPGDYFDKKIDSHMSALRILNYPHQDQEPGKDQIRASPHTDYGSLTILAVDDAPGGLQVMDHDGKWHDVKAPAGSYVVNLGDLMQHWTNDEWRSTMHRVINPPAAKGDDEDEPQRNNRRQSIAFFHNINGDVLVECFPSCQSPEHPSKYAPVLAGEYLMMKHEAAMGRKK